ncbi:hypothetical protein [Hymenobacter sp. BRD67]|uniref:hypothetical protein n=1 Tax=Hymenobacter sp. BRD67 TaxID=2675877 RepID=UPI0015656A5E|nr:hypothetical protein [Hymenobacter sp. BRD67]QKG54065.1 hypothetical protein GKZ67_17495 [Hymenobacter sp. BRD67]
MKLHLRFLAFALGTGLAFAAPLAAQAQVSVGVNIGLPAWGPPVPQGTQYYYIPEIDGYYDIYNGVYIVFQDGQWIQTPYLDGYDPYYFHPVPVSYAGPQPWLYINTYRSRYPQYVTVFRRGGYGGGGQYYGHDYGAGRVYGYDRNRGREFDRGRDYRVGQPHIEGGRDNRGGFGGGQPQVQRGDRGGFGGGQPQVQRGGFGGGQPQVQRGGFGGGQPQMQPGNRGGFGAATPGRVANEAPAATTVATGAVTMGTGKQLIFSS